MPDYIPSVTHLRAVRYTPYYNLINDYSNLPHSTYSIAYILRGDADFTSESSCFSVCADEIIFIPLGAKYISHWHGSPDSHFIAFHFETRPFCDSFNRLFEIQKISGLEYLKKDFEYISDENVPEFCAMSAFGRICHEVVSRLKSRPAPHIDERIQAAAEFLRSNCSAKISILELAHMSNMSIPHFQRCFKKEIGISPIEYKNRLSISNAARMLLDNRNMTVEAVSLANGFESSIYFRRQFKAYTGKTPAEYRKTMSGGV